MGTFHLLCFFVHSVETFLVAHNLLDADSDLIFQTLHFIRGLGQFVHFFEVVILIAELSGQLLGVSLDVFLCLVLAMTEFGYFVLQLLDHPERQSFRVLLTRAQSIADVVVVVSDIPHSVGCFQFVPFVSSGLEGSGFLGELTSAKATLSTSLDKDLLYYSRMMVCILTEVE